MTRRTDLERRVEELSGRIEFLDTHGSRGLDGIRIQMADQGVDIGKIEGKLDNIQRNISVRQTMIYLAALLPVYVLLFLTMFQGRIQ